MNTPEKRIQTAYYRGTHPYSFRTGERAEIIGVRLVNKRPCFLVLYPDGVTDLCLIFEDRDNYLLEGEQ